MATLGGPLRPCKFKGINTVFWILVYSYAFCDTLTFAALLVEIYNTK